MLNILWFSWPELTQLKHFALKCLWRTYSMKCAKIDPVTDWCSLRIIVAYYINSQIRESWLIRGNERESKNFLSNCFPVLDQWIQQQNEANKYSMQFYTHSSEQPRVACWSAVCPTESNEPSTADAVNYWLTAVTWSRVPPTNHASCPKL